MADPSTAESQELVRFPDVPKPPGLDEKEQYAVMLAAAKRRGGLRTGEDLTALPAGTPGPGGAWKSGGTITASSGTVYDVYTRDPAPEGPTPSDTPPSTPPPGSDALQDVDKNFSPGPPDNTVAKCVTGFAEGFVEGFAVGYAVGFLLGALGPVGAVIGVGLLLYSAYQVVTNWDNIKAAPPEEKARMIGGLAGGILGGGMGARAGGETVADLPPEGEQAPKPPKPSPKFKPPTNPPQLPPEDLPPDVRLFRGKPTEQYSNGYWKIEKFDGQGWQRLDPRTMKPGPHPDTHVPFPDGYNGPFDN